MLLLVLAAAFLDLTEASRSHYGRNTAKGPDALINRTTQSKVEVKQNKDTAGEQDLKSDGQVDPEHTLGKTSGLRKASGLGQDKISKDELGNSSVSAVGDSRKVRLLNINTWHEGTVVAGGFEMLVNVIFTVDPDVVVLSEVHDYDGSFHKRLRSALVAKGRIFHGAHGDGDVAMLSFWPIDKVEHVANTIIAYHLQAPWPLCVCAAHLDYHNYATVMPRGYHPNDYANGQYKELGKPETDVKTLLKIDDASGRGPALQAFLSWAKSHDDTPLILAGDFNECSHLDWTAATADLRDHHGVTISWRHSLMLTNAGFQDSWRELYPDAVTHPGATWPSEATGWGNTGWAPKADEHDRIDFAYHNSGVTATGAWLVGSPRYYQRSKLTTAQSYDPFLLATQDLPWPSDHKGLYVEFTVAKSQPRRFRGLVGRPLGPASQPLHRASKSF